MFLKANSARKYEKNKDKKIQEKSQTLICVVEIKSRFKIIKRFHFFWQAHGKKFNQKYKY